MEERLLAMIDTASTTGETLTNVLLTCLTKHGLRIEDIVGQGYDGGSNMRGAHKGVQARIKQINPVALFTHCFAHNLNRALVNAACDATNTEVRNIFGTVELVFTFVEGSSARHTHFINLQKKIDPNSVPLHLMGLSETRWNCRAYSLRRLTNETVFSAVMETIDHVSSTTTDGTVRGTAAGLLVNISSFKFILSIILLTPVLEAINTVSEYLQSDTLEILKAQRQVGSLKKELIKLRSEQSFQDARVKAVELAEKLNLDPTLPVPRPRKVARKIDDNAGNQTFLTPLEQLKINVYYGLIDRLLVELNERFPDELTEFAFLDPRNFQAIDAEIKVHRLASRYKDIDPDIVVSQWRLAHHFIEPEASIWDVYKQLPSTYTQLRFMYKVLLTLPVTTASVERGFSKLTIVKSKLRSTMNQERLEALMLASIEKDLLLQLDDAELVANFASKADRRMLLA